MQAPFYDTYRCADSDGFMAVGALEPQFFKLMTEMLGLSDVPCMQLDRQVEYDRTKIGRFSSEHCGDDKGADNNGADNDGAGAGDGSSGNLTEYVLG